MTEPHARKVARQQVAQVVMDTAVSKGWSILELATRAGVDPGTVGDFLRGLRWPRPTTLGKIEKAFGWDIGFVNRLVEKAERDGRLIPDDDRSATAVFHGPMSLDQIEDLIPFLQEQRLRARSKRVAERIDETIQLLELARDDRLRQELLAYGEVRRRPA